MKNRTLLRIAALLLVTVLVFAGCASESGTETTAEPETAAPTECIHDWEDGICTQCQAECPHETFVDRRCALCNIRCPHRSHDQQTLICPDCGRPVNHNYVNGQCTMCDETSIFQWESVPAELRQECANQGTVQRLTYTTHAYALEAATGESDILIEKELYVYLPYGYNEDTDYNVLYLMHGGGGGAGYWLGQGEFSGNFMENYSNPDGSKVVNILDNMIDQGICEPLIVVTPTFYSEVEGYEIDQMSFPEHFSKELKNEIMPLIAQTYSTYAQGTLPQDFVDSRDHQAYAGLSMGSITGFQSVLGYCTDYISYIGNFSGCKSDMEVIAAALNGEYVAYPINYWFNANGGMDMAHDEHFAAYEQLLELCPEKLMEGDNCIFVDKPTGSHSYGSWEVDLYNALLLFFQQPK